MQVWHGARLRATIMISYLPCIKVDVEAYEMIQNHEVVFSLIEERLISQLLSIQWIKVHFKWNGFPSGLGQNTMKNDNVL